MVAQVPLQLTECLRLLITLIDKLETISGRQRLLTVGVLFYKGSGEAPPSSATPYIQENKSFHLSRRKVLVFFFWFCFSFARSPLRFDFCPYVARRH